MKKIIASFLFFLCISTFHSLTVSAQVTLPSLKISGEVNNAVTLNSEDLAKMPHTNVMVKSRDGKENNYSGVAIQDLFALAGVSTGRDLSGENLSKYVIVKCADGYEVVFSLAEMDSSYTDRKIILADAMNNKPLSNQKGPFQLAVPGEKRPARSCSQVIEFIIRYAK